MRNGARRKRGSPAAVREIQKGGFHAAGIVRAWTKTPRLRPTLSGLGEVYIALSKCSQGFGPGAVRGVRSQLEILIQVADGRVIIFFAAMYVSEQKMSIR